MSKYSIEQLQQMLEEARAESVYSSEEYNEIRELYTIFNRNVVVTTVEIPSKATVECDVEINLRGNLTISLGAIYFDEDNAIRVGLKQIQKDLSNDFTTLKNKIRAFSKKHKLTMRQVWEDLYENS